MIGKASWFVGCVTLAAAGAYVFVYLYRWEWHRALFVAVVFVAAEVALVAGLILRRLAESAAARPVAAPTAGSERSHPSDPRALGHLRATAPRPDQFAWLRRDLSRTNVFVTILLGGGAIISAGAWALDRLAARTTDPARERALAERLQPLSLPDGGLVTDDAILVAQDEGSPPIDPAVELLLGPARPAAEPRP